ncbi:hypothetical protein BCR33DRAFT_850182 [Rhizoclosmatium globosum]|uniref:Uncharacterized protein n=1 Tax=Rhizoclosmatium globosum TaxID=329046 RepID=A0A1Y2CEM8_9FUNG|nr:hypothetical protein BCR33DRAFT_850182 [Rhizoclosmatium globosum]|eukprot:ORY45347.1 hypothetical protein BCR33DRAFT_850182 [Rhizoclosmatium globosum]
MQQAPAPSQTTNAPTMTIGGGKERYAPTVEEMGVIRAANRSFLFAYGAGIGIGVIAGFSLTRVPSLSKFAQWKTGVVFATSLTGEYLGRKLGEVRAQSYLQQKLPHDSVLRTLLAKDGVTKAAFEIGGTVEGQKVEQPEIRVTAWESIRKMNQSEGGSAWARVRMGKPVVSEVGEGSVVASVQQRKDDDLFAFDAEDSFDSNDTPSTSASTPTPIGRPRTREEEEELVRQGKLRRNRYGDFE